MEADLKLRRNRVTGLWECEWMHDPERAQVVKLFGGPTVSTPFGNEMEGVKVADEIGMRNPGAVIEVEWR